MHINEQNGNVLKIKKKSVGSHFSNMYFILKFKIRIINVNCLPTSTRMYSPFFIYYTTRGLKILDYTRRVARKHHEIVDRVVFPATRRVIENFPSSRCIRVDYIMNKINK
jgi:hypothetical protein